MLKRMRKQLKNEKGLTLIELLAVIVILAIVAAIAVPAIGNIIENSRAKTLVSDAVNVMNAANIYFTENPSEQTATIDKLKEEKFLESEGKLNEATVTYKSGDANTISAQGKNGSVSLDIKDKTLKNLTDAKVKVESGSVVLDGASSEGGEGDGD